MLLWRVSRGSYQRTHKFTVTRTQHYDSSRPCGSNYPGIIFRTSAYHSSPLHTSCKNRPCEIQHTRCQSTTKQSPTFHWLPNRRYLSWKGYICSIWRPNREVYSCRKLQISLCVTGRAKLDIYGIYCARLLGEAVCKGNKCVLLHTRFICWINLSKNRHFPMQDNTPPDQDLILEVSRWRLGRKFQNQHILSTTTEITYTTLPFTHNLW